MKMRFEISEWKENEMVALRMVSGPMMKSYEQFWKIEGTPTGSRISFSEDIEFSLGVIGKMLDSIEARESVGTIDRDANKTEKFSRGMKGKTNRVRSHYRYTSF